ncbi:dienelactone hydrolase family protein [Polynucleobacter kasalickyi]|uniref:Carboxymethylenebutenolidase n=1 Tax=Polynucleobacter kasalickyi TaxID=1938817 RepID=A0A1W2AD14_9BURK|nr:dienelactone hydrolase family protein [Polynucleobacter kasalickyi]SMC58500.1 carboxymethylenebutenolidase [Polynucleobacter kasalickyi]
MGSFITLKASDGFEFLAFEEKPVGPAKGGLVLLQEIFGVNTHIQEVAKLYADQGYHVLAPETMARAKSGVNLGYTAEDMAAGSALKAAVEAMPNHPVMLDIQTCINTLAPSGKVGIFGFCWGGLLTWRSAAMLDGLSAAVTYYGGGMPNASQLTPKCPVLAHFADNDSHIPLDSVQQFSDAHPEVQLHIYAGQHGFNCNHRGSYDETAALLARSRTLTFFSEYLPL